jgi:U3 small nucleolar RNA-associated protein 14
MLEEQFKDSGLEVKRIEGWGEWAGEGITISKAREQGMLRKRERKLQELKAGRKDANLDHVIINEMRDKKFKKYMVQDLPHPFKSKQQFES